MRHRIPVHLLPAVFLVALYALWTQSPWGVALEERLGLREARTLDSRLHALTGEHILIREETAAGEA